jgi:hypothetical protein
VIVLGAKVKVPDEFVIEFEMVRPFHEVAVDVANVRAPVWAVPYVWMTERTPVFVMEGAPEPRTVKPVHEIPVEHVADDVAMLPKVLAPVKYGMLPMTACDDVPRPLKLRAAPEMASGNDVVIGAW